MGRTFQAVTKVAIEEIMQKYLTTSKFGYFLSGEDFDSCLKDLTQFIEMSRNLKAAGDRFIQRTATASTAERPKTKMLR